MWDVQQAGPAAQETETPAYYRDLISEMYDTSWYGGLEPAELAYYLSLMRNGRALEFPVGTGRLAIPLLEAGVDVYGLDNSPHMLSQLVEKLAKRGLSAEQHRFILWAALNTPYPCASESFDVAAVAFASFSLMHSNSGADIAENRVLRELNRILRPGGTLVINDYRTGTIDIDALASPHMFNHRHTHPVHGEILEEQTSEFKVEPNALIENQIIRYRKSSLVRIADNTKLRECQEITPIWDVENFPTLGTDAGFEYVTGEVVDFYEDATINHVFVKQRDCVA